MSKTHVTTTINGVGVPETKKDWMVGGSYNANFARFFLTYGGAKTEIADYDARTTSLGAPRSISGSPSTIRPDIGPVSVRNRIVASGPTAPSSTARRTLQSEALPHSSARLPSAL